ncbi:DMT family transporter [Govanella unica]|uniref:DMT family transporter n=1 Tax=Govanella unica TaxID=2975056 RepID=A0A9X3TXH7_9PROT|nr:DMT family transporter [Govania unica]
MRSRIRRVIETDNGTALVLVAVLCWVGNFVVARAAAGIVPPVTLAFVRWVVAGGLVSAFYWRQILVDWPLMRRHWGWLLVLGVSGIGIYNSFVYIGLQTTIVLNLLILNASLTLMVALISYLFFRERLRARQSFGILLSMAGVLWIVLGGDITSLLHLSFNDGDLWIISGVFSYAIYTVFLRKRPAIHPMSFIAVTFLIGAIFNLPFFVLEVNAGQNLDWSNPAALATIAYVVLFPSIVSYICFNRGVAILGATRASTIMLTSPIIGAVLAMLVLGERLTMAHLVGGVLVFSGILVSRKKSAGA